MAFSTRCSKKMPDYGRRLIQYCVISFLLITTSLWAAEIEIQAPLMEVTEDGLAVSADLKFELGPRLEEAVSKGVVLHFVAELEGQRPRWWWLDEKVLVRSQSWRLSYHALTRQYRVSTGSGLYQSFASLGEALRMLSRIRHWYVADKNETPLRVGEAYRLGMRVYLDLSQLPRPFQISALGNREWNLSSEWRYWKVQLSDQNGRLEVRNEAKPDAKGDSK